MLGKLTTGAKIGLAVLVIGLIVGGIAFFKDNIKSTKSNDSSNEPVAVTERSEPLMTIGLNTWAGFAGIVYLNNGLEPNEDCILYKQYGLKLRIKIIDVFNDSRNAFKTGALDMVYCTVDALPVETGSGSDMVKSNINLFFQIDWSRGGDLLVVTKGIKTVADLKGKTISVAEGTASHTLLIKTLESNGLTANDVLIKKVEDGIESAKLFKSGTVDAALVWSPDDGDCLAAIPGSKVLLSTKTATHIIADGLLARAEFISANKAQLIKLCSAWLEANAELNTNEATKQKAAQTFAAAFKTDVDFALNGINNVRFTTLGDNKDFFGLNPQYLGITGEQLYSKMSIVYSDIKLTNSPLAWRTISNVSIIESITLNGSNQVSEGAVTFTPVTEEVKQKEAISNKKITINFATNSYTLDDNAKSIIDREFGNIAKSFLHARVRIEGNTDNTGNYNTNMTLSMNRAQAVANYLAKEYKFDPNRFIVIGNGPKHAVEDGIKGSDINYRTTDFRLVE